MKIIQLGVCVGNDDLMKTMKFKLEQKVDWQSNKDLWF